MRLLLLLFCSLTTMVCFGQEINNVQARQEGQYIIVNYDLDDAAARDQFTVTLYCSTTGGYSWGSELQNVSGDVGYGITGGRGKQIIWDVLKDKPVLTGARIAFEVRASPQDGKSSIRKSRYTPPPPKIVTESSGPRTISGTVTDENGEPLIGVSVIVQGTIIGTITDLDGEYSITVQSNDDVLIYSYTGYTNEEIKVRYNSVLDVILEEGHFFYGRPYIDLDLLGGIKHSPFGFQLDVGPIKRVGLDLGFAYRGDFKNNRIAHLSIDSESLLRFDGVSFGLKGNYHGKDVILQALESLVSDTNLSTSNFNFQLHVHLFDYRLRISPGVGKSSISYQPVGNTVWIDQTEFPIGIEYYFRIGDKIGFNVASNYIIRSQYSELEVWLSLPIPIRGVGLDIGYEKVFNTNYQDFLFRISTSFLYHYFK